jgi:hypothetical protein
MIKLHGEQIQGEGRCGDPTQRHCIKRTISTNMVAFAYAVATKQCRGAQRIESAGRSGRARHRKYQVGERPAKKVITLFILCDVS